MDRRGGQGSEASIMDEGVEVVGRVKSRPGVGAKKKKRENSNEKQETEYECAKGRHISQVGQERL